MTEALGKPEQRTTSYTYTHRADDPFLLTQSTETKKVLSIPSRTRSQQLPMIIRATSFPGRNRAMCSSMEVQPQRPTRPRTSTTPWVNSPRSKAQEPMFQTSPPLNTMQTLRRGKQPGSAQSHCQCPWPKNRLLGIRCQWECGEDHRSKQRHHPKNL